MNEDSIDINKLRNDLKNESLGAFFGAGAGGALMEAGDIEKASDDEILEIAKQHKINLDYYRI